VKNRVQRPDWPSADELPETLELAHLWLAAHKPALDAPPAEQQRFHELSADIYTHVAITDPARKDWARKWAIAERQTALKLAAQIAVRAALASYLGPDFDASD
jgi:hypothetical protein